MFICTNHIVIIGDCHMGRKKRERTKQDDVRDVLLELCREHSGPGERTVTGMAAKFGINKGQVSAAVTELSEHLIITIGDHGAHKISLKCDIPTLEKLYATFGTDFYVQDVVMSSACFQEVAQVVFARFREMVTKIKFNIYPTWWSDQPATPEEQKIFNRIRRDKTRAHVFELSFRGEPGIDSESIGRGDFPKVSSDFLDWYRKSDHHRIGPPSLVDCNLVISDSDVANIQIAIEDNWLAIKFMLIFIDPENDTLDLLGRFLSDRTTKRKLKCYERFQCASYGSALQNACHGRPDQAEPKDPTDPAHLACAKKLCEYAVSVPIVDWGLFFSELRNFYENYTYLL